MANNIIFIGTWAENERLDRACNNQKKCAPTLSGNNYTIQLLNALKSKADKIFEISVLPGNSFPLNKKLIIKDKNYQDCFFSPSFWNGKFLRNISLKLNLRRICKNHVLKLIKNEKFLIVCCDPRLPLLQTAIYLKKRINHSKIVAIFPDLPHLTNRISKNPLFKILKKIDANRTYNLSNKFVDNFVFFSREMPKYFSMKDKKYIYSPGIIEEQRSNISSSHLETIITYTGSTDDEGSQIKKLVSSFEIAQKQTSRKIKLIIAGGGGNEEFLENVSKNNSSIVYYGLVSPAMAKTLQSNSDILISLRPSTKKLNSACPSKIFEYLSYSKPIICFKMECIPDDLDSLLIHPETDSDLDIAKAIANVNFDNCQKFDKIISKYSAESLAKEILRF